MADKNTKINERDASKKLVFLLRHGTAENEAETDHARPLAIKGREEAQSLGGQWREYWPLPEVVYCSDARRTRDTMEHLGTGLGQPLPGQLKPEIYHASPGTLLDLLQHIPSQAQSALLIGHNPTMHQTAAMLSRADAFQSEAGKWLMLHYAPCTLSVLALPEGVAWSEIEPAQLTLHAIHSPKPGWLKGDA